MADQLVHLLRHVASQGGDITPFRYGHIASYDPLLHRVRCIIPSMTDQDGVPLLSPWMPMGTLSSGTGFGIQPIYHGGASVNNPTAGEQVLIAIFDRQRGVAAVPCAFYGGGSNPPATNLPTQQDGFSTAADAVTSGDLIISAPPADPGGANTFVRLRKSGQIQIWSAGQLQMDVIGGLNATVNTGDLNVTVSKGNATVQALTGVVTVLGSAIKLGQAATDALKTLCTSAFQALFNVHEHVFGSTTSGPPTVQADASTMTTVVTAE